MSASVMRKIANNHPVRGLLKCSILLTAALTLASCATGGKRGQDTTGDQDEGVITKPVTIDGIPEGTRVDPDSVAGRAPKQRVIYFDFDTVEINSQYLAVITDHGRFLAQNPSGRVRLEGHTDERGSREYNIALGEGRARSIARMMQLQGVDIGQMQAVSYGEELPVDEQHNETAWTQNRRVNIIYEVE